MALRDMGRRIMRAGGLLFVKNPAIGRRVINKTGSSIARDKLVAIIGFDTTSGLPKVVLADANDATHADVYVTTAAIANDAQGNVYKGAMSAVNLNTNSATAAGDPVYLSETAGGFAHTKPSTANARVIPVGWVETKSATVGEIHWAIQPEEEDGQGGVVDCTASTLTWDPLIHDGRTVTLNRAAGITVTLPAATGSGVIARFAVGTTITSNQYRFNVTGNDSYKGILNMLDLDGSASAGFAAGADADQIDLNGTTKGGVVGDFIAFQDTAVDVWTVLDNNLQVPAGSNPATPFATGQIS